MESEEVGYRAVLALVYWELTKDIESLHIFYEKSESCSTIATAALALHASVWFLFHL